jgi:hypothetical protein
MSQWSKYSDSRFREHLSITPGPGEYEVIVPEHKGNPAKAVLLSSAKRFASPPKLTPRAQAQAAQAMWATGALPRT